jgi:multiple sugar transport system substrate-binding protein
MAMEITKAGNGEYYGIGLGIKDPGNFVHWLDMAGLAGGPVSDGFDYRTGQYAYGSDPAYSRIVELLLGMKSDGSVFPSEGSLDDNNQYIYFGQGKFAIMMSGTYAAANLASEFPDLKNIKSIPLPEPPEGRTGGLTATRGFGMFFLSARSGHPDEAWLWLDWLASQGYGERYVKNGLDFSVYTDVNTPENIGDGLRAEAYAAATIYIVRPPYPPQRNIDAQKVIPEAIISEPGAGDLLVGIYTGQITDWKQAFDDLDRRKQQALYDAIREAGAQGYNVSIDDYIYPDFNPIEDYG